jgi:hypothetical protein
MKTILVLFAILLSAVYAQFQCSASPDAIRGLKPEKLWVKQNKKLKTF